MTCNLQKLWSAGSNLRQNLDVSFARNGVPQCNRTVCCNDILCQCAQHHDFLSILSYDTTQPEQLRENKRNRLNNWEFPLCTLIFAQSGPARSSKFSSEWSHILLCATIIDLIFIPCAYGLQLSRPLAAATRHDRAARSARAAAAGPQVPQYFEKIGPCSRRFAQSIALIIFISYSAA